MIGTWIGVMLALGAAVMGAQATAAELVVVESRGLTLKPGETVNDSQKITLQKGDELTLVDESGAVIKPEVIMYLNRLSDVIWLFARLIEFNAGVDARLRDETKTGPKWSRAW